MKTIVISDLHHRVGWVEPYLSHTPHDRVVFLGDYFDSFYDTTEDAIKTALWVREALSFPNRILLMGNHDMPYRFPNNQSVWCPGFTKEKAEAIGWVLEKGDWDKIKVIHEEQGWILSHAGVHPWIRAKRSHKRFMQECEDALCEILNGNAHSFFEAGVERGGRADCGGITWLDWRKFSPIKSWNQIVGHSEGSDVRGKHLVIKDSKLIETSEVWPGERILSENYCMDTHNAHVAIIKDEKVRFEVPEL